MKIYCSYGILRKIYIIFPLSRIVDEHVRKQIILRKNTGFPLFIAWKGGNEKMLGY